MYGSTLWASVRGITAELDGEVVGIAGLAYAKPIQCFSVIKDELKNRPRDIVRAAKLVREMLDESPLPVYATPDVDAPTACKFLTHIGFVPLSDGEYEWPKQYQ